MSIEEATSTVARARALRAQGPGIVVVTGTTSVDFVGALRDANAVLSAGQQELLRGQMAELASVLEGIEGEASTLASKPKRPWWMVLFPNLTNASKEEIARANHNHLVAASGAGTRPKPVPRGLLRAAEAALIAEIVGSRIDSTTRALLTGPWKNAYLG